MSSEGKPSYQESENMEHAEHQHHTVEEILEFEPQPSRWYNTGLKLGSIQFPAYNSANVQILMLALVFFLCPGMYNALSGLGGGGQLSSFHSIASNSSVALYCTFAGIGFFAGSIANTLGAKYTLALGGIGYAIYSASLLCFNHTQNGGFVIAAGAILGMCAACLWAAQGLIIMSYPTENSKGRGVAIFWAIFNLGAVIGSLIPLIQTVHEDGAGAVSDGTYAAFLALMILGAVIALALLPSQLVKRSDKTHVIIRKHPSFKVEIVALFKLLKTDTYIILLFPAFFASNWFYTYQFNAYNLPNFTLRTRSLNSLLYWVAQIIGALTWGMALDYGRWGRKTRARVAFVVVAILTMAVWGGGLAFAIPRHRGEAVDLIDWSEGRYIGPMFLYIFYGLYDAVWQTYIYWILGALSNSGRKLALFAGFYKGIQSAGAAVVWRLDALSYSYMSIFISSWVLLAGSLIVAFPVIFYKIKDHCDVIEDLAYTEDVPVSDFNAGNVDVVSTDSNKSIAAEKMA